MNIRRLLNLSYVPRWVIVPMMRQQTVSDHSWRVSAISAEIMYRISEHLGLLFSPLDYTHMWSMSVMHDADEVYTGDTPSTAKAPSQPPIDLVSLIVKTADVIESYTWAHQWAHPDYRADVLKHVGDALGMYTNAMEARCAGAGQVAQQVKRDILEDS